MPSDRTAFRGGSTLELLRRREWAEFHRTIAEGSTSALEGIA
jgi:hypothetical protein